jgi:hypothetical protein
MKAGRYEYLEENYIHFESSSSLETWAWYEPPPEEHTKRNIP